MCWVMPPVSPEATSDSRMRSNRVVLPWSTWPMTVTTGGRGRNSVVRLLFVLVGKILGLELGFLLLARLDQTHLGADLGRKQLDHVVRKRHGGGHHFALCEQETHHIGGAAVEPGGQLLSGRTPFDYYLALGDGRVRSGVSGRRLRLKLPRLALRLRDRRPLGDLPRDRRGLRGAPPAGPARAASREAGPGAPRKGVPGGVR